MLLKPIMKNKIHLYLNFLKAIILKIFHALDFSHEHKASFGNKILEKQFFDYFLFFLVSEEVRNTTCDIRSLSVNYTTRLQEWILVTILKIKQIFQ